MSDFTPSNDSGLAPEIKTDPLFEGIRKDARFKAILNKFNFPKLILN